MRRILALCVLPFALGAAPSAGADTALLVGTVGPGFTIDLADASGTHVSSIPSGRYEILVHDLAAEHNFVLGSKTTNSLVVQTEVEFVGDMRFTIDLPRGFYVYACSPHFQTMFGRLTAVAPTSAPKALTATVGPTAIVLSAKRVSSGAYRLRVVDRSRTRNFHLIGPGVNRRTSNAFSGSVTWTLQLQPGTYRFGSDPKLIGRLVVA